MSWRRCTRLRSELLSNVVGERKRYEKKIKSDRWSAYSQFVIARDYETSLPGFDIFRSEKAGEALKQCTSSWRGQPYQQDTVVCSWSERTNIRKIQVLRNEEASSLLSLLPDGFIRFPCQIFLCDGIDVVTM